MAVGAAEVYEEQLGRIGALSPAGAAQAAADTEYFCNVLSALGVPLPPPLATWQVRHALASTFSPVPPLPVHTVRHPSPLLG